MTPQEVMAKARANRYFAKFHEEKTWDTLTDIGKRPWIQEAEDTIATLWAAGYVVVPKAQGELVRNFEEGWGHES